MGVIGSKFDLEDSFQSERITESSPTSPTERLPSNPVSTPTPWSLLDPRSPTANIARTPLEVVLASKALKTDPIETDIGNDKVLISLDPRSPTVEFLRTPLIVEVTPKSRVHNKNLDNARNSLIPTSKIVPPKLLDSSPITRHPNAALKRRSMVGLLETNIDFTETDLNNVCGDLNKTLPDRVEECVTPLSNKLQTQTTEMLKIEASELSLNDYDPQLNKEKTPEIIVTGAEEEEIRAPARSPVSVVPEVNVTAHVKDFEKKLTNLIYEDDSAVSNNVKAVRATENNNRTPLGDRNLNGEAKNNKSVSKLKVSDRPRKFDKSSKIPVFKEISHKRISKGQINCENTPPAFMSNKSRKSHWDADQTLEI